MWRAVNPDGTLTYSFVESVQAMHPYYVVRLLGGIIRRGIEEGEFDANINVESVTAVLVGSFDGLFLQAWFDPNMNPLRAGTAFIDVVIRGLETCGRKDENKTRTGGSYA